MAKVDELSRDERAIVVGALRLKAQSVQRAERSETNAAVRELRTREVEAIASLIAKFSF